VKLLRLLIGAPLAILGATWLFWAGIAFEHRPAGWPNWQAHWGPFHATLKLPDSPSAQLAAMKAAGAAQAAHTAQVEARDRAISAAAGKAERAAQARIQWRVRTQLVEIPAHVTAETDQRYPLPYGLLRVHDAAARGVGVSDVPLPAGRTDDDPSGVAASDLAAALAANYGGRCRADAEQLTALQAWIRDVAQR
jgi:hypothetical protein